MCFTMFEKTKILWNILADFVFLRPKFRVKTDFRVRVEEVNVFKEHPHRYSNRDI